MVFDRIDREPQLLRNLRVGVALCDQLEQLQFAFTQWVQQWLHRRARARLLKLTLLLVALLAKGYEYGVQIRGQPLLVLLLPQQGEQAGHRSTFVHKDADVPLWLSQGQRQG